MKEAWKLALLKLVFGAVLFGAWIALVVYYSLMHPKDPTNSTDAQLLVLSLQSAYAGLGFVHMSSPAADFYVNMVKAAAAACILLALAVLVYFGLTPIAVLVTNIGVALTALGIVNKNVSDPKSGE